MTSRRTSPEALLAAAGLDPRRAQARLRELGLWSDDGPTPEAVELVELVSAAASPDDALHVVADLAAADRPRYRALRDDPALCRRLVALAGGSRPLGDLVARDPAALDLLAAAPPVEAAAVAAEVRSCLDGAVGAERSGRIATVRRRHTALIAARDLAGELDVEEVGRSLSALADGVLAATLDHLAAGRPPVRLCVVAMGKLGGEELNYVSDIDVVFVHEPAGGSDDEEARSRAQALAQDLLRTLNATTSSGRPYEVDATLRPEGRDGPLSRTVAGFVSYWERWAETWEYQALLKARPAAGDLELGERLLGASVPFVYPDELPAGVVDEVRHMKGRVEAKAEVRRHGDRQLKLGPGGLRDIEFAVQLLQLVHGRADERLRVRGTLGALRALADGGYVAREDADTFAAAYRELRTVEHRLQLADERRTHTLPEDGDRLERLARSLGFAADADRPAREAFLARLRTVQGSVRDLHAKLFYRPLLDVHAAVPATDAALAGAPAGLLSEDAALTRLEALGFRDARAVLRDIRALTEGVSRRARGMQLALPGMLHALVDSPDPDAGMRALRTLVESAGDEPAIVAVLRDQPPAADLLARMLGTSEVVAELLVSQPQGVEWIADPAARADPRGRQELVHAARGVLRWQSDLAGRQAALRRFKRRELARIVVRDLAGDAGVSSVGAELAALGDACLEAGLEAVLEQVGAGREVPRIAVVGMGKLGGRELHYVSDLDVVFVHEADDDDRDATRTAIEVAERVLTALSAVTAEGTAFEVDPELRPEGRSGPLSRSLSSCRVYYDRWAEPWEHQALLRARTVAGDADLGQAFVDLARVHAYPLEFGERDATAMRRMKARIERERVPRRSDAARHLKLGPGGLTDIEWTVQLLQRRHGAQEPRLRTTSTMGALDALEDAGLVSDRDAQWLRDGYRFLTATRNRLYLLRQRDVDTLPASAPTVEKLARSLGYGRGGRQDFEADHLRTTRHVRRVTERLFYGRD